MLLLSSTVCQTHYIDSLQRAASVINKSQVIHACLRIATEMAWDKGTGHEKDIIIITLYDTSTVAAATD